MNANMPLDFASLDPGRPYVLPYGRCSDPKQLKGETVARQEEDNERIAQELGLPLHPGKFDPGLSGYTGANLVRGVLDSIRAEGVTVVPGCEFVAAYMERHPEYRDLLPDKG